MSNSKLDVDEILNLNGKIVGSAIIEEVCNSKYVTWFEECGDVLEPDYSLIKDPLYGRTNLKRLIADISIGDECMGSINVFYERKQ